MVTVKIEIQSENGKRRVEVRHLANCDIGELGGELSTILDGYKPEHEPLHDQLPEDQAVS